MFRAFLKARKASRVIESFQSALPYSSPAASNTSLACASARTDLPGGIFRSLHTLQRIRQDISRQIPSGVKASLEQPAVRLLFRRSLRSLSRKPSSPKQRQMVNSTIRAVGSTAVLAGTLGGVKSMLTDTSVGHALRMSALVIAGFNTVGFVITATTKSHKITDLTGTSAFIGSVWATHAMHCHANGLSLLQPSKSLLLTGIVSIWGVRLAGFLFHRVLQTGKDTRLSPFFPKDDTEPLLTGPSKYPLKLAGFWTTQGLWAWLVCLPVTVAHAVAAGTHPMGTIAWVGAASWALGFGWEAVADYQKAQFKAKPENKGKFMDSGLFRYSRYPNYFGEILAWTGVYLIAGFPSLWLQYPWIAASPGFTAILLLYVSGIPITEETQAKRYGSDPNFKEYKATTSTLIPLPKLDSKHH